MPAELPFKTRIRDPVHGEVPITALEARLLYTRAMTRLANVKQMGLTYLKFPGATHSRLEHSIGVMHVAYQMAKNLAEHLEGATIFDRDVQEIRIAALLHDVGHPPLSHSVEEVFRRNPRFVPSGLGGEYSHEKYTYYVVTESHEIREILEASPGATTISADEMAKLATGKSGRAIGSIVSGELDADRIDYNIRDSYYTGVPYGAFDLQKLLEAIRLHRDEPSSRWDLVIEEEGIEASEALLVARYHLITSVHNNRDTRIVNRMLVEAIEEAFERILEAAGEQRGLETIHSIVEKMHTEWDDHHMIEFLRNPIRASGLGTNSQNPQSALIDAIFQGTRWRRIREYPLHFMFPDTRYYCYKIGSNPSSVIRLERRMRDLLPPGMRIIPDILNVRPPHLHTKVNITIPGGKSARYLMEWSPLAASIVTSSLSKLTLRLYCNEEEKRIVSKHLRASDLMKSMEETHLNILRDDGPARLDALLLTVRHLCEVSRELMSSEEVPWVKGDAKLMRFFKTVLSEVGLQDAIKSSDEEFWEKFDADLETLTVLGLIHEDRTVVRPENYFTWRYHRRISKWGERTCAELENRSTAFREFSQKIREFVKNELTGQKDTLSHVWKLRAEREKTKDENYSEVLGKKIDELRKQLKIYLDD